MPTLSIFRPTVLAAAWAACAVPAFAATAQETPGDPLQVELVAEHAALVPGRAQSFGVLLHHQPHWHSYWINPGDSGLPTTLEWTLPPGWSAGAVEWPVPKRFDVGGLYNAGFEGETLLPIAITVPADAVVGSTAHVALTVKWLACREECIPGKAFLTIDLPVVAAPVAPDARWTKAFSDARLAQPQANAWTGSARDDGQRIAVRLEGAGLPPPSTKLDAFAVQRKVFDNKPPAIRRDGDALVIETGRSEYFTTAPAELDLVVVATGAAAPRGWHVRVPYVATGTTPAN